MNKGVHAPTPHLKWGQKFLVWRPCWFYLSDKFNWDSPQGQPPDGDRRECLFYRRLTLRRWLISEGTLNPAVTAVRWLSSPDCSGSCIFRITKIALPNTPQRPGTIGIVSPRCSVSSSHIPVSNNFLPVPEYENYMFVFIKAMLGVIARANTRRHDLNVNSDR